MYFRITHPAVLTALLFVFNPLTALCDPKQSADNQFAETFRTLNSIGLVAIAPLEIFKQEYEQGREAVTTQLINQLADSKLNFKQIDPAEFELLDSEIERLLGGYYSPKTGEFQAKKYIGGLIIMTKQICKVLECEAIVFPSLVLRPAETKYDRVRWDGASRKLPFTGDVAVRFAAQKGKVNFTGFVQGLSIQMLVVSKDGEWQATTYGAISVPNSVYIATVKDFETEVRANKKRFKKNYVRDGVKSALYPLFNR